MSTVDNLASRADRRREAKEVARIAGYSPKFNPKSIKFGGFVPPAPRRGYDTNGNPNPDGPFTSEELHVRAVQRKDKFTKWFMGADGKPRFTVEYPKPPHAPRGTSPRVHRDRESIEKIRMFPGSGPVSRLSMVEVR